jgi:hypothetical protein
VLVCVTVWVQAAGWVQGIGSACLAACLLATYVRAWRTSFRRSIMGAEADAMLALMRAGVPNAELLVAKGLQGYRALAQKHGIRLPDSALVADVEHEEPDAAANLHPEPGELLFDVRRFTPSPSHYAAAAVAPVVRPRKWRWQVDVDATPPLSPEASMRRSPTSRPPPTGNAACSSGDGDGGGTGSEG